MKQRPLPIPPPSPPHLIFCDCKSALCLPLIALYGKKEAKLNSERLRKVTRRITILLSLPPSFTSHPFSPLNKLRDRGDRVSFGGSVPYPIFGPNQKFHSFPIKSSSDRPTTACSGNWTRFLCESATTDCDRVSEWESDLFHAITINPAFVIPLPLLLLGLRERATIQKIRRIEQVTC